MTNHTVKIKREGGPGGGVDFVASCACRQRSKIGTKQDAEEWEISHLRQVERARASLTTRTPQLASQRDYYRERAEDPDCTAKDRALWRQLAEELDGRLNDDADRDDGQLTLL